jgi:hypothetical protein
VYVVDISVDETVRVELVGGAVIIDVVEAKIAD